MGNRTPDGTSITRNCDAFDLMVLATSSLYRILPLPKLTVARPIRSMEPSNLALKDNLSSDALFQAVIV